MEIRHALRGWRGLALLLVIGTGVFAYSVGTKLWSSGGNVVNVSDQYNFSETNGGSNGAPSWIGMVEAQVWHNGVLVYDTIQHNTITNTGEGIISACTARGATGAPACTNGGIYIALSADTTPTSASDTSCPSEAAANGLARTLGTYSSPSTNSHKVSSTFTYTGTSPLTIAKVCMFDASSGGNLFADDLLSTAAAVSTNGDQITINWSFTH